jgi:hypothetical protein
MMLRLRVALVDDTMPGLESRGCADPSPGRDFT